MTTDLIIDPPTWRSRAMAWPLVRIITATLYIVAPVALVLFLAHQLPDKSMRQVWPQLLCTFLCIFAYGLYVRQVEQRIVAEMTLARAWRELGQGALLGAMMFQIVLCALLAARAMRIDGVGNWQALFAPLAELVLVAVMEELLFRGILYRIIEKSLGTVLALIISGVLFALAHLPNENITALGVLTTAAAGVMFCSAYLLTGRLWLPIGIHFAWNYCSDAVFALPASGHAARGFVQLSQNGPQWLTGGAYGVEASALTLGMLVVFSAVMLVLAVRRNGSVAPFWAGR